MALDVAAEHATAPPLSWSWTWRDAIRYALAVGAGPDELPLVYEGQGPLVLPSLLSLPAFEAAQALFPVVKGSPEGAMVGEHTLRLARPC